MNVRQLGICSLVLLAGCSSLGLGNKGIDYHAAAAQAPSLDVPPDLSTPGIDDRFKVPQGEAVSTFSDYNKGGSAQQNSVLPEVKGVSLERIGTQRYLLVKDKPDNIWPILKAFLQENGLPIKSEDKTAGLIETEWVENRAAISQDYIHKMISKVFENAFSSGERDQYRIRLERAKDGTSTEVYITHRGMEDVVASDSSPAKWQNGSNTTEWQPRASDPEKEAIMLQRLMARFGVSDVQAAKALLANVTGNSGAARIIEISGNKTIAMEDSFDHCWRKVGLAIERAELTLEDKDRAKGIYFLNAVKAKKSWLEKLQVWKDKAELRYRVNVKDSGNSCEVSIANQNGASDDTALQLIDKIYKNINL